MRARLSRVPLDEGALQEALVEVRGPAAGLCCMPQRAARLVACWCCLSGPHPNWLSFLLVPHVHTESSARPASTNRLPAVSATTVQTVGAAHAAAALGQQQSTLAEGRGNGLTAWRQ